MAQQLNISILKDNIIRMLVSLPFKELTFQALI